MEFNSKLLAGLAMSAVALTAASAANAGTTYVTTLDWGQSGYNSSPGGYGTVTLEQLDTQNIRVTVLLNTALLSNIRLSDNGNGHVMFGFNLSDTPESVVTFDAAHSSAGITGSLVSYSTSAIADGTPGGNDFANQPFGHYDNAWEFTSLAPQTLPTPFAFNVFNQNGITPAGTNAVFDSVTGRLVTPGTIGNRFFSNSDGGVTGSPTGGWWFSADTSASGGCTDGPTCAVAGRDMFRIAGVPEPATWAMMILGMGGAGAVLRRRRKAMVAFA